MVRDPKEIEDPIVEDALAADMLRLIKIEPCEDQSEVASMKRVLRRYGDKMTLRACIECRDAIDEGRKVKNRMAYMQGVLKRLGREATK